MSMLNHEVIRRLHKCNVPLQISDGRIQVLDPSLLPGGLRQFFDNEWKLIEEASGPEGSMSAFEQQFSEATSWVVNHNLGRTPVVTLLTQGGAEMLAEVLHVSPNQFVAYFASPMAGSVRCV